MSTAPIKTKVSLEPANCVAASDAEAFARAKFIRVLQSWACDRLAASNKELRKAPITKAA